MSRFLRRVQTCLIVMVCFCLSFAATGCREKAPESASSNQIKIELGFTALWWSEEQMEGMNISDPPPKQTVVRLAKWEASDPVGTPHPESFSVHAQINSTANTEVSQLTLKGRWGIGNLAKSEIVRWSAWESIAEVGPLNLAADEAHQIPLGSIPLDKLQENLYRNDEWPWIFEAEVDATISDGKAQQHIKAIKQLEILAGD